MAAIEVLSGAAKGQRLALDETRPNPVGSSQRSTVRLTDGGVFFKHATIECRAGVWVVVDERSVSGTTVNGAKLARQTSHPLADGDLLAFGTTEVRFLLEPAPAEPQPVPEPGELERLRARVVEVELRARTYADELARASYALTASDTELLRAQAAQLADERDLLQLRCGELQARATALEERRVRDDELYEVIVRQRTHGDTHCEADPTLARSDAEWTKMQGELRDLRAERDAALAERDRRAAEELAIAEELRTELASAKAELTDRTAQLLAADEELRQSR